jgi:hypothetical protein
MKKYKIKVDKKLINSLKPFWRELQRLEDEFYSQVQSIEAKIAKETNIDGIEFFMSDGYYCGVGNAERTMRLIHDEELNA